MKKKVTIASVAALLTAGLVAGGVAIANESGDNDKAEFQALNAAAITMQDAVSTAEAAQGGKAMSAEFDAGDDGEPAVWEVEFTSADGKEIELHVDATTGNLIAGDQDEDHEEDDDRG